MITSFTSVAKQLQGQTKRQLHAHVNARKLPCARHSQTRLWNMFPLPQGGQTRAVEPS